MEDRILQTAQDLFFAYGIKSVTMDDLARHMAVSKKTIYKFYTDKNQLVERIVDKMLREHTIQMEHKASSANDAIHEVILQTQGLMDIYIPVQPGVYYDLQKYFPNSWTLISEYRKNELAKAITANLERGVAEGVFRPQINIQLIKHYRMAQIADCFNERYVRVANSSIIEIIYTQMELYLRSIVSPAGQSILEEYLQLNYISSTSK